MQLDNKFCVSASHLNCSTQRAAIETGVSQSGKSSVFAWAMAGSCSCKCCKYSDDIKRSPQTSHGINSGDGGDCWVFSWWFMCSKKSLGSNISLQSSQGIRVCCLECARNSRGEINLSQIWQGRPQVHAWLDMELSEIFCVSDCGFRRFECFRTPSSWAPSLSIVEISDSSGSLGSLGSLGLWGSLGFFFRGMAALPGVFRFCGAFGPHLGNSSSESEMVIMAPWNGRQPYPRTGIAIDVQQWAMC